jgi:uncharacterized glyoxalase superfamily protein PhnB
VSLQMSAVLLGVEDVDRAKKFYAEGLGGEIDQDFPGFARLRLGEGSSLLALTEREAAAQDAGVSAEGSGFTGVSLHFITDSRDTVDEVMQTAQTAGATVVKEAADAQWGGYFGYFSDPDGYLWKVTTAA